MIKKHPRGIYTVIALGMTAAFLLLIASLVTISTDSLRQVNAIIHAEKAEQNAESALTWAIQGLNSKTSGIAMKGLEEDEKGEKLWEWRIVGADSSGKLSPEITLADGSAFFSYPAPGGGSAGHDCDTVHPVKQTKKDPSDPNDWNDAIKALFGSSAMASDYGDASDHPCNWHRFTFGDPPIEIPLWGLSKQTDGTYKMADIALTDFRLRVRTPCKIDKSGVGVCKAGERFVLEISDHPGFTDKDVGSDMHVYMKKWLESILKDTPFYWAISGECNENPCAISEITDITQFVDSANKESYQNKSEQQAAAEKYMPPMKASAISAKNINKYLNDPSSAILYYTLPSKILTYQSTPGLKNYVPTNITSLQEFFIQSPQKLSMRLSMIKGLIEKGGNSSVPHLEYQILYKTQNGTPIIGNPTIIAEGYSGGFKKTLEFHATKHPAQAGLVFENQ